MSILRKIIIAALFCVNFMLISGNLAAQGPPPPPGESNKGTTENQGAPIDSGMSVMMLFATVIAAREWYKSRQNIAE